MVKHNVLRLSVLAVSIPAYLAVKANPESRDILPEPLDIPDHTGNIPESVFLGYLSGLAAGKIYSRLEQNCEPQEAVRKTRTVMAIAGFCVGLAANIMAETRFGQSLLPFGKESSTDTVDLFYGVATATAAAAAGPSVQGRDMSQYTNVKYIPPEQLEQLRAQDAPLRVYAEDK